jgi:hypothetical protein
VGYKRDTVVGFSLLGMWAFQLRERERERGRGGVEGWRRKGREGMDERERERTID